MGEITINWSLVKPELERFFVLALPYVWIVFYKPECVCLQCSQTNLCCITKELYHLLLLISEFTVGPPCCSITPCNI